MYHYDELYPEYGFAKHKGYGTKLHTDVLKEIGPCLYIEKHLLLKYVLKINMEAGLWILIYNNY